MFRVLLISSIVWAHLWAIPLVETYRTQGVAALEKQAEEVLQSRAYWDAFIGEKDVSLGYYEREPMLVLVDKTADTLKVFEFEKGNPVLQMQHPVITGIGGDKQREGDLKTPVGVYEVVRRFVPSDPFYGQIAFALSYPNIMDKRMGKDGYGIWIHGHPLNSAQRYDQNTRGCVVMTNDLLDIFDAKVQEKKTLTLISEAGEPKVEKETIVALLTQVFEWRNAWKYSDVNRYMTFYHEDFRRFDGMRLEEFTRMKRTIFSRNEDKMILFNDLAVVPYPNEEGRPLFRVSYHQTYETKNYQHRGNKEIYVDFSNNQMKILVER
ncbi:L,D-transpeptidase family protein [Sulfurospirillum sp. T05]|uniref:L,D-transpeptidase family protein n=1 Tax=Sulfurospirillum tamanense TaxID=2813362 RepID=A0ABS2WPN6_9BACT|nr:L,D-transpeptidase family protein [Sulfurospirillum tamanensis]